MFTLSFTLRFTLSVIWFTLRFSLHTESLQIKLLINWKNHWNGGRYSLACVKICSRMFWLTLSNAWKGCRGLFWEISSQAFFMLLFVPFRLGLPTLRYCGSRGQTDVAVKVTWCWGCCLSLRSTCLSSFSFLCSKTSVSGLIFLSGPIVGADTASFAFW